MTTEHDKLVEDCKRAILALKSNHEEDLANAVIAIAVERCAAVMDESARLHREAAKQAVGIEHDVLTRTAHNEEFGAAAIRALLSPNEKESPNA